MKNACHILFIQALKTVLNFLKTTFVSMTVLIFSANQKKTLNFGEKNFSYRIFL